MPDDSAFSSLSLLGKIAESAVESHDFSVLIDVLALICLFTIITRKSFATGLTKPAPPAPSQPSQNDNAANNLQKTLGDLLQKAGSGNAETGPSPEMLASLLPLLNNPQLKAKMNPANLATIFGLLNSFNKEDPTKKAANGASSPSAAETSSSPAATASEASPKQSAEPPLSPTQDAVSSRYLNWKTNL